MCLELVDDPPIAWPTDGQVFEVAIGYEEVLVDVGSFSTKHIAVSGPPRILRIEASALNQGASLKNQREESWDSTTLGDIVATIARRNGLKPAVIAELQSVPIDHEDQTESDIAFLLRLGRRHDMVIKLSDRFLMAMPEDKSRKASCLLFTFPIRFDTTTQASRPDDIRAFAPTGTTTTRRPSGS
ncbi:hypothetical protein [Oligoflexus sp.]|uniref:hypothetical protein n=1 Tax=Oligoflexus sp. TaxID=1971216 RepID=UPI002D77931E|nr:hypothetical protein [Oligoflexus sp.]